MLDRLGSLIETLKGCVGDLDAGQLGGDEAMELCARFAELERLAGAGRLVTAERVAATEVWRRGGMRTAADWVSRSTGFDIERARDGLETAGRLGECPVVSAEVRAGRLSEAQAHAIVDAVAVRPDAEGRLVEFARSSSLRRLREECRRGPEPRPVTRSLTIQCSTEDGPLEPGSRPLAQAVLRLIAARRQGAGWQESEPESTVARTAVQSSQARRVGTGRQGWSVPAAVVLPQASTPGP